MRVEGGLLDVLESVAGRGLSEIEVFHKRGRSRSLRRELVGETSNLSHEEGFAVRAGDDRRSFFYAAAGPPRAETPWPEADGAGLSLPEPRPIPEWSPADDFEAPLVGENEARALLDQVEKELDREIPGAKMLFGFLEDGASEQQIASSRGVRVRTLHRAASLFVEARGPNRRSRAVSLTVAEREARRFRPEALARRLADRLLIHERGSSPARDRGEFLLSHDVMSALLSRLLGLFVGGEAAMRATRQTGPQGRRAGRQVTLIDDGRLPGGLLESPVDGEGMPTGAVKLVEEGVYRQPLTGFGGVQPGAPRLEPTGCRRRPGWRDLPVEGASHFYLRPDPSVGVADLLSSLSRGYYLLGVEGAVRLEDGHRRFAVPVSGFAIDGGRATGSIAGAWLTGSVPSFLGGVVALGRDLMFQPTSSALVGSPSAMIRGLELRQKL
ncbi:MAG: metallopeptidase TldD-related protein [Acidobacteriota bacterium]